MTDLEHTAAKLPNQTSADGFRRWMSKSWTDRYPLLGFLT